MERAPSEITIVEYSCPAKPITSGIIHLHWPDGKWDHPSFLRAFFRGSLFISECIVWKLLKNKLIWTAHNVHSHENRHPRLSSLLWNILDRLIDGVILLSQASEQAVLSLHRSLRGKPRRVILHGHYKSVLSRAKPKGEARDLLAVSREGFLCAYIGAIREYKNVEGLIDSFEKLPDGLCSLMIAGKPDTDRRRDRLRKRAQSMPNLHLRTEHLSDSDLQTVVEAADLIILPYTEVLNSGSVIYALSNDRPVLVPETPVFKELASLIPAGWIHFFSGAISSSAIQHTIEVMRRTLPPLDLKRFDWDAISDEHIEFFRALLFPSRNTRQRSAGIGESLGSRPVHP